MATIFLRAAGGGLEPMQETDYVNEAELQLLLASYSDLLPGNQIDPESPRKWLFIGREVGVPGTEGGGNWLSLDHLFIDQDGIPTFVECKRAADTRARREVVAQMLDYAANGTAYWTVSRLQELAVRRQGGSTSLDDEVRELVGGVSQADVDRYWQRVGDNLKTGKVRLIFVLDEAPSQLRRLVEFLNEQMTETEVLILEVKQFRGAGDQQVLVPRLIGRTEKAAAKHAPRVGNLTVADVLESLDARSATEGQLGRELLDLFTGLGARIETTGKGFVPAFQEGDLRVYSVRVGANGGIAVYFHWIRESEAFADPALRLQLLERFRVIAGEDYPAEKIDGKFEFPILRLADSGRTVQFKSAIEWFVRRLRPVSELG